MTWWAIAAVALGTYAMKAAGPVLLGARTLPPRVQGAFALVAVALLGALIATSTIGAGASLTVDARAAGVAAGAVAIMLRAPFAVVIIVAAVVAAALRAAGVG